MCPKLLLWACLGVAPALAQPVVNSVINGGSGDGRLSPGVLATILGRGFSPGTVAVTVYGLPAPVVGPVNTNSITVQFPLELPAGTFALVVQVNNQMSAPFNVTVSSFAPAYANLANGIFSDGSFNPYSTSKPASAGKQVVAYLVGLGPTNPPVPVGQSTTLAASVVGSPSLSVGGKPATIVYCGMAPGIVGTYQLTFLVPNDISAGNQDVLFSISGVAAPRVQLATTAGVSAIGAITNGATFQVKDATHPAAPNSFISIFASNLPAGDTQSSLFPATSYQGVSVLFNGGAVPLYFVLGSRGQINLVTPSELADNGTVPVTVQSASGPSATVLLSLTPADVGIFLTADPINSKRRNGAVLLANTAWQVMPLSMARALGLPSCAGLALNALCGQPASPGDPIQIYFTGGGKATPGGDPNRAALSTGSVAPADGSVLYQTVQNASLTIGGLPAQVLFCGIAPGNAGLYQVNAVVPTGVASGDEVPMVLTIGSSSDTATIAVR